MILLVITIYIVIFLAEVPGLVYRKYYKELFVFIIVFLTGVYMSLAFYYQWPLAAPFQAITTYMERLTSA